MLRSRDRASNSAPSALHVPVRSAFYRALRRTSRQEMANDNVTLTAFCTAWQAYQDRLTATLALLTAEQLALRAAPELRSIGENAMHIVGCRVYWFAEFLGEDGGAEMKPYARWNAVALDALYVSRAWVVWHGLEHDLHLGGELSLTLGTHGIPAHFAL